MPVDPSACYTSPRCRSPGARVRSTMTTSAGGRCAPLPVHRRTDQRAQREGPRPGTGRGPFSFARPTDEEDSAGEVPDDRGGRRVHVPAVPGSGAPVVAGAARGAPRRTGGGRADTLIP